MRIAGSRGLVKVTTGLTLSDSRVGFRLRTATVAEKSAGVRLLRNVAGTKIRSVTREGRTVREGSFVTTGTGETVWRLRRGPMSSSTSTGSAEEVCTRLSFMLRFTNLRIGPCSPCNDKTSVATDLSRSKRDRGPLTRTVEGETLTS